MSGGAKWSVRLFGAVEAHFGDTVITRFRTRKAASLFAYLAYNVQRDHARDELADRFWPDAPGESSRNSLKQELSALRRVLEPVGVVESGSVLIATRSHVRLNPQAIESDAERFVSLVKRANIAADHEAKRGLLERAVAEVTGEFAPGDYEDWAAVERTWLQNSYQAAANELSRLRESAGSRVGAIELAAAAVRENPYEAALHERLLDLFAQEEQYEAIIRHFGWMERMLDEIGAKPSAAAQEWVRSARQNVLLREPVTKPAAHKIDRTASIPIRQSTFVGRGNEMAHIANLVRSAGVRLLSLTGTGGIGKTRMSIELAHLLAGEGASVYFVALADERDGERIPELLLRSLGETPKEGVEGGLIAAAVGDRPTLWILDNLEQMVESAAPVVARLLRLLPNATFLVTSRIRLQLAPELEIPLTPLNIPSEGMSLSDLAMASSVGLYVDRARSARADFALTPANAEDIASICRRLDGLPLAIEMAAGWARALTPKQTLARLSKRFDVLQSKRRDIEPRHQTMWQAIEWSVQMLTEAAVSILPLLSVFRGGFTLDEAEVVCESPLTLEAVAELLDHSLLYSVADRGEIRYQMFESVREYAWTSLNSSAKETAQDRHARAYEALARQADAAAFTSERSEWLAKLTREIDNLRAALEWLSARRGMILSAQLWRFWQQTGRAAEGQRWLAKFLPNRDPVDVEEAKAFMAMAFLTGYRDEADLSETYTRKALAVLEPSGQIADVASCVNNLADLQLQRNDFLGAFELYRQANAQAMQVRYIPGIAISDQGCGIAQVYLDAPDEAEPWFYRALTAWQSIDFELGAAYALEGLASIAGYREDYDRALAMHLEVLAIQKSLGHAAGEGIAYFNIGDVETMRGHYREAIVPLREGVRLMAKHDQRIFLSHALTQFGVAESYAGSCGRAAQILGGAEALRESLGVDLPRLMRDKLETAVAANLLQTSFAEDWKRGRTLALRQLVELVVEPN